MSAILKEDPPDLSDTNQNISPTLERLVNHVSKKILKRVLFRDIWRSRSKPSQAPPEFPANDGSDDCAACASADQKTVPWLVAALLALALIAALRSSFLYFRSAPHRADVVRA